MSVPTAKHRCPRLILRRIRWQLYLPGLGLRADLVRYVVESGDIWEMTWTKLDDTFLGDPKFLEIGPIAELAFVRGLVYCGRHLTDGLMPTKAMPEVCRGFSPEDVREVPLRLISVGLWVAVAGGYQVPNYLKYQPSKKKVEWLRNQNAKRQRNFKAKRQDDGAQVLTALPRPARIPKEGGRR
jgi:hypothetical protein